MIAFKVLSFQKPCLQEREIYVHWLVGIRMILLLGWERVRFLKQFAHKTRGLSHNMPLEQKDFDHYIIFQFTKQIAVFVKLQGHSSRLAALDYTVCLHSEVFVSTQGGNFPHFLIGHRRYLYKGHAETIKPDKRKLVQLLDKPSIRYLISL